MTTDHDAHLGRVDKDGFIHVGRASDLIIRGGNNIDPVVIEHALLAHPEVTGGRIPQRAATPTEVTIVDTLPVTAVGSPNKVALRADAIAREVRSALVNAGISISDDCVVWVLTTRSLDVVVYVPDNQHLRTAISVALKRYPLRWRFSQAQR